jgi:hypothetical protein
MADEITVSMSATVVNGNFRDTFRPPARKFDQTTAASDGGTVSLSSVSTTINLSGVSTNAGLCMMTNTSTSVDILVGPSTTAYFLRLPPKSSSEFWLVADTTINCQTTISTASLQYKVFAR